MTREELVTILYCIAFVAVVAAISYVADAGGCDTDTSCGCVNCLE